ncbi:MAG: SgcJ/EcaC family oxidoreductase [Thermoanaerobaculia bacterium]|nr:SgcJ/EcaC family oxidoreductase [Thermoanaerobaculia bacterium]
MTGSTRGAVLGLLLVVAALAVPVSLDGQEESTSSRKPSKEKEDPEAATPAEIRKVLDAWDEALERGDVDGLSDLLHEEIVLLPQGRGALEAREEVLESYRALFAQYTVTRRSEIDEIRVAGDWAFVRGVESFVLEASGGGERLRTEERRMLSILRRGEDGRWRFAQAMTNRGPEKAGGGPKSRLPR